MWEICFEKSEVLNGFLNDIRKGGSGKGGETHISYQGGRLWMGSEGV